MVKRRCTGAYPCCNWLLRRACYDIAPETSGNRCVRNSIASNETVFSGPRLVRLLVRRLELPRYQPASSGCNRCSNMQAIMRSSDTGNVKYPPLTLNRWKVLHAPDGTLPISFKVNRAFRCPSVPAARSVIRLIPPVRNRGAANPHQLRGFAAAIKKHGCRPTSGRYMVMALHENAFISLGYESGEDWTALTVKQGNISGIGLVYDASFD